MAGWNVLGAENEELTFQGEKTLRNSVHESPKLSDWHAKLSFGDFHLIDPIKTTED